MGFSFNPAKAITRALGISDKAIPIVNSIFPVFYLANKGVEGIGNALYKAVSGSNAKTQAATQIMPGSQSSNYYYAPEPSGFSSYGSGGNYAPDLYTQPNYEEIPPWDYSIYSQPMNPVPVSTWGVSQPVYYQTPQASTGLDLTELLTVALPLFL